MAPLKEASVTFLTAAGDNGPCDCLVAESEHAQHELAVPGRSDQGVCVRLAQNGREIGLARVVLSEGYFGPLSQCSGCATRRANRAIDDRDIDRLARNRVRSSFRTRRRFVLPFRAAIANTTAFRSFFEPKDHLTNGSLVAQFASISRPRS